MHPAFRAASRRAIGPLALAAGDEGGRNRRPTIIEKGLGGAGQANVRAPGEPETERSEIVLELARDERLVVERALDRRPGIEERVAEPVGDHALDHLD